MGDGLLRTTAELSQRLPSVAGREQGIAVPFQYLFTGEDGLRLTAVNVVDSVTLRMRGRWLGEGDDHVRTIEQDFPLINSGQIEQPFDYPLNKGVLLSLVVRAIGAFLQPGQCFVRVEVVRGRGATQVLGTLLSAYLGSWNGLGWPGTPLMTTFEGPGWVRAVSGNTPAPASSAFLVLPTGVRWKVRAVNCSIGTSAVPGTRRPYLVVRQDNAVVFQSPSSLPVVASAGPGIAWGAGAALPEGTGVIIGQGALPIDLVLDCSQAPNASIEIGATGMDAADQIGAMTAHVEEWRNLRWSFITP